MLEKNTKFHMQPTNLFATPEDLDALMEYINRFYGGEKTSAMICAMMAWNLGCKIQKHNDELVEVKMNKLHKRLGEEIKDETENY